MKRSITFTCAIVSILIAAVPPLAGQSQLSQAEGANGSLTIEEIERIALDENPALRAHRLRYEAARAQAPQASALPDARVGFGYFAVPVETRLGPQQASISFSQSFPWFGTLGAEEDAAMARARQHFAEYADARNRLIVDVRADWYRFYVLERSLEVTAEHIALVTALRAVAVTKYETGSLPFSHLLRLDMELEQLRTSKSNLEEKRHPLLRTFARHLNREVSAGDIRVPDSLLIPSVIEESAVLRQTISDGNPKLRMLDEEGKYWEARQDAARRMGYPSFTLGVTYTTIGLREDMDAADNGRDAILPQVGLSFPLFGSRYSAMEEQAQLQRAAAREMHTDQRNRLTAELQARQAELENARRGLALSRRLSELARKTLDVMLVEYSTGETGIDEVLVVERELLRHALDIENMRAEINRAFDEFSYLTAQEKDENHD